MNREDERQLAIPAETIKPAGCEVTISATAKGYENRGGIRMNREETERHIGMILLADNGGKTIVQDGKDMGCIIWRDTALIHDLMSNPERYSIKPEPRVIFVNVYLPSESHSVLTVHAHENSFDAEKHANKFASLIAHRIEIPGE